MSQFNINNPLNEFLFKGANSMRATKKFLNHLTILLKSSKQSI